MDFQSQSLGEALSFVFEMRARKNSQIEADEQIIRFRNAFLLLLPQVFCSSIACIQRLKLPNTLHCRICTTTDE